MLGLDNPIHILFLLILLLLVFGAKRLPELGRSLGSGMRGFKDSLSGAVPSGELAPPAHQVVSVPSPAAVTPASPSPSPRLGELSPDGPVTRAPGA